MKLRSKIMAAVLVAGIGPALSLAGCEPAEFAVDDAIAQWQGREATLWTFDNNSGQTTASVEGKAIYPFRNTNFDSTEGDSTKKGSVVSVSVGDNVVDLVGSSTVICDSNIQFISRADIDIAAKSDDPAMPWLNVLKRRVSDLFTGQDRLVVIKTQNDIPVLAFTADSVSMVSGNSDIPNSTWFKVQDNSESYYCWVHRTNYMAIDTALLN